MILSFLFNGGIAVRRRVPDPFPARRGRTSQVSLSPLSVYLGSKNHDLFALKVYLPGPGKEAAYKVEADFLAKLNYKHLINMVDHRPQAKVKIGNRPEEKRPLIVLELAEGGELFEFLSKTGRFTPEVCRVYFKQILAAIRYLVSVDVAHRDLKPENILFDREFTLKVSDFGLSRDAKGNLGDYKLTSRVGTEGYKPPEMEQGNYTGLAADMFAAGVVLFIMFNGTPPFLSTKPNDRIYQLIKTKNFAKFWALHEKNKQPGHFPDAFKRLVNSLLSSEIDRRPNLEDIEKDDWLCGDELMNDDLITFMKGKAEKLSLNDPNKKKMA